MRHNTPFILTVMLGLVSGPGCSRKPVPLAGPAVPAGPAINVVKPEMRAV